MKEKIEIDLRARLLAEAQEIEGLCAVLGEYVDTMGQSAERAALRLKGKEPLDSIGIRGMSSDLGTMTARLQRRLNRFDYLSMLACELAADVAGPVNEVPIS